MNKKTLFHATTPNKVGKYHISGMIREPVRGFETLEAAVSWAWKTGRQVILKVEGNDCHKLPDHHNKFGDAYWIDHDVKSWEAVFTDKRIPIDMINRIEK